MTINSLQVNNSTPVTGLGTQTFNVITAGLYTVSANFTIPHQAAGSSSDSSSTTGQSALQIVINNNGSALLTVGGSATNPTPTQPTLGGTVRIQAAANDVFTIVLTSANAVDATLNAIKGIVNVYQGQ